MHFDQWSEMTLEERIAYQNRIIEADVKEQRAAAEAEAEAEAEAHRR